MPDLPGGDPTTTERPGGRARARSSLLWLVLGLALVGIAMRVVARSPALDAGLDALRASPWWVFAGLLAFPLLNLLITSATFQVLTGRYGRVGFAEMAALIAGAWLFSFVGMFGRIIYHREIHGVPARASVLVLAQALGGSFVGVLLLLGLALLAGAWRLDNASTAALLGGPVVFLAVISAAVRASSPGGHGWRWPAALLLRYLDMAVWALRYLLLFSTLYGGVSVASAAGFAAAAQAAMLVPIQVGLREWVIGLLGAGLAVAPQQSLGASLGPGLLADLINRLAELVIALPLGVLATVWLARRWHAHARRKSGRKPLPPLGRESVE
ncbi:MAG: hypothetical protein ACK4WH_08990 [Phycisphaerales bacterium]